MKTSFQEKAIIQEKVPEKQSVSQPCPQCDKPIGVLSGSVKAICKNCGYKDPCCE